MNAIATIASGESQHSVPVRILGQSDNQGFYRCVTSRNVLIVVEQSKLRLNWTPQNEVFKPVTLTVA